MHRYQCLFAILMLCLTGQIISGQSKVLHAQIQLARTVVESDEAFAEATVVRNAGSTEQSLIVWDCSYAICLLCGPKRRAKDPSVLEQSCHGYCDEVANIARVAERPSFRRSSIRVSCSISWHRWKVTSAEALGARKQHHVTLG
jgi:hypothetical protein